MSSALKINGRTLHPIKEAVEVVSYSRDYVTRLAREEKIVASLVGRQWFIDLDSLKQYTEVSAMEQELRKKQLSEQRVKERQMRDAAEKQNTLHLKKAQATKHHAVLVASLVLGFGLLTGWATHFLLSPIQINTPSVTSNLAQVNTGKTTEVVKASTVSANSQSGGGLATSTFSRRTVEQMSDVQNGILLLPQATSSEVEDLFSDTVKTKQLPSGERVVVQVDAEGNEYGVPVPFVEIPVHQSQTTYE